MRDRRPDVSSAQNSAVNLITKFQKPSIFVAFQRTFITHVSWCSHKSSLECLCITRGLCSCPLCVTIATPDHVSSTPVFSLTRVP